MAEGAFGIEWERGVWGEEGWVGLAGGGEEVVEEEAEEEGLEEEEESGDDLAPFTCTRRDGRTDRIRFRFALLTGWERAGPGRVLSSDRADGDEPHAAKGLADALWVDVGQAGTRAGAAVTETAVVVVLWVVVAAD